MGMYKFRIATAAGLEISVSWDGDWEEGATPTYGPMDPFVFQIFYDWLGAALNARGILLCPDRYSPRDLYEALRKSWAHGFRLEGQIPDQESLPMAEQWDEDAEEQVLESAQVRTPATPEENIRRGMEAMKRIISRHVDEPRAMFRQNLGWITFPWGEPGDPPPVFASEKETLAWWKGLASRFELFSGGYGISHIIAKRDWEGKWIKEFQGQKGVDVALDMVRVIARGRIDKTGSKATLTMPGISAGLELKRQASPGGEKGAEYWLITGFAHKKHGYKLILESVLADTQEAAGGIVGVEPPCPTCIEPTRRPTAMLEPNRDEQATPGILSDPTHAMPTGYRHGMGAADPVVENIHNLNAKSNISPKDASMNAVFERASLDVQVMEKEVRSATTFEAIESLFQRLFGITSPIAPDGYKDEGSDYGIKIRGKKAREKINAQCREILGRVKDPSALTPEDRAVLAQYSGRGGLTENSQYEYYTPKPVAEGVWDALAANGFVNGNVLDPCCGAGIFSGTKPGGVVVTANDLDPVGSGVAALLNPQDTVSTQPFERVATNTPDDTFDSCVGNVPFGNARGASLHEDPAYKNEKLIERYFLHRIIDKIKPGGLACLVVPTNIVGSKGKRWEEFRIAISRKAEFLGAHKLPSKTFGAQGTDTVVDVIVLRKHTGELAAKVEELTIDSLRTSRVVWSEFVEGRYWQGEGRPFIMGRYVPKQAGDRWGREVVDGDIDDASLKRKLAQKFHSRIDWESLAMAEPVVRAYSEGDRKSISGTMYEFVSGQWQKVVETIASQTIEEGKFGAKTLEELRSILASPKGTLGLGLESLFAVYKSFPDLLDTLQREAVEFAMSQAGELFHEQIFRGCIIGGMLARMASKAEAGEDVSVDRAELQEMVSAEVEKYGHPRNNKGLVLAGGGSRLFGMFKNAVDEKGNFSDLLAGTLDKAKRETAYDPESPADIVSHLFVREGQQDIFLEDVQALYKGGAPISSLSDLAEREDLAITPDGRIMPLNRYCAGDIYPKMADCAQAIAETDDIRLQAKFRSQIEAMRARQKQTKSEDIAFGLRQKWMSRKYAVEFLRENGFPRIEYGSKREVDVEQYDGSVEKEVRFAADYENPNGEFSGLPGMDGFYKQFEKYLNGGKITSSKEEYKQEYLEKVASLESQFNVWLQQHPDIIELTEQFNRQFNGHVPFEYEGDALGIDEYISGEIVPHSYQNAEVRRLSEQGSGICGFGVGLGKSFTALAAAAYNHKKGRAKRTCVVVPAAVLENWYHEARQFYAEGYMRSSVMFVGLEPKVDKDGAVQRRPVLDEKGNPRVGRSGETVMQDVVSFRSSKEDIHDAMWRIPQSNTSLVVMTKEKFATIPLRPSTKTKYTEEMVSKSLMSEKLADKIAAGKKSYQDDKSIANMEAKYSNEGTRKADELPYLEDMGFDSIITDESHFFKNSFEAGKESQGIAYLPTAPAAQIAIDMAIKSHYIRGQNGGRGVYGLTATPVTNSPFEVFNMLSLVAPIEEFERFGVHTVDDFVRVFGKIETVDKVTVAGEIKAVDGLVGFQNLDGLRNLFHKYVTVKTVEDVESEIHVPSGQEVEESVTISQDQAEIYEMLRVRAKLATAPAQEGTKRESIFSIIRDMDRLTTDIDMYRRTMTFVFQRKHREAVDALLESLPAQMTVDETDEETGERITLKKPVTKELVDDGGDTFTLIVPDFAEELVLMRFPERGIVEAEVAHPVTPKYAKLMENLGKHFAAGGKQLVFTDEKTQHQKLRRIIVHHLPVTSEQIGIINAEDASGDKLDKISKAYNAGQFKIVIANKKAEVGVNLQKGTTAIHHLTLPWTPASINQRNGRGVRQGNSVDSVALYYYCGKGTFDSYRKDVLKAKANWISDLLLGDATNMENGDVTGMDDILDMLADNPEEAKRMRAERMAAAKTKREEAFRATLTNKLQVLASIQGNLETLDTQKEERRAGLNSQLDTINRGIQRFQAQMASPNYAEAEKEEIGKKFETAQRRREKIASELSGLDVAFEKRRNQLEANKKLAMGTLRQAERDGRLPFDAAILDNPVSALVTGKGDVLRVGDTIEVKKTGDIWKVSAVDQAARSFTLTHLLNEEARRSQPANNLPEYVKVSYSESELALKKILSRSWAYAEIRSSGIDREIFAAHIHEIQLSRYGGGVYRHGNKLIVDFGNGLDLPEGAVLAWPEPENEDWRKALCVQFLEGMRGSGYLPDVLMRGLFGTEYMQVALAYGRKGTEAEILALIADAWEARKREMHIADAAAELYELKNIHYRGGGVLTGAAHERFDNKQDIGRLARDFLTGMIESAQKKEREAAEAAELEAQEALKADPRFKDVPAEVAAKLAELGITVRPNVKETSLPGFKGRKGATYEPFSRWFLQDKNAKMGVLFRMKDILKARHGAQFTSEWGEFGGAWWHMPSSVNLEELHELLV